MSRRSRLEYSHGHGRKLGVALPGTLTLVREACREVHLRSVLRFASSFHPTRPHGKGSVVPTPDRHLVQLPSTRGCLRQAPQRTCTSNHSTMPNAPASAYGLRSVAARTDGSLTFPQIRSSVIPQEPIASSNNQRDIPKWSFGSC